MRGAKYLVSPEYTDMKTGDCGTPQNGSTYERDFGRRPTRSLPRRCTCRYGQPCLDLSGIDLKNGAIVAIKVPHVELELDPVFYERFRREQEIGQKLNHPRVMKVLPSEHHSRDYIVMEWIDGTFASGDPYKR